MGRKLGQDLRQASPGSQVAAGGMQDAFYVLILRWISLVYTDDLKRLDNKKYSAKITIGIEGLISIYLGNRQS